MTNCACIWSIFTHNGCSFYRYHLWYMKHFYSQWLFILLLSPLSESLRLSSLFVSPSSTQISHCMHWSISVHFIVLLKHEHKWGLQPLLQEQEISSKSCWRAGNSVSHSMLIVLISFFTTQPCLSQLDIWGLALAEPLISTEIYQSRQPKYKYLAGCRSVQSNWQMCSNRQQQYCYTWVLTNML